ncbi:MAG: GxxExxY protein [Kiritimatiellae bacterium]|nr:GxxExxY protein [Kiritimatiellia bacterium]
MELIHKEITEQIIGSAFEVHRALGYGFLESVYQRAMIVELKKRNARVEAEVPARVYFKGECVGEFYADLVVDDKVVVELKIAKDLNPLDEAQLINEIIALRMEIGLLINFGREGVKFKRAINQRHLKSDPVAGSIDTP